MSNLAVSAGEMATDDAGHDLVGVSESPHEYESDHELLLIEAEDQVCAIVPGQHVTMHKVQIPSRSDAQARIAAPFALEDYIAADLSDTHVAVGSEIQPGVRPVLVAAHTKMQAWTQCLPDRASSNILLVPDYCALSVAPGAMLIVERDGLFVFAAHEWGGVVDADCFDLVVQDVVSEQSINQVRVYSDSTTTFEAALSGTQVAVEFLPGLTDDGYHDLLAAGSVSAPVNLLQGPYSLWKPLKQFIAEWRTSSALVGLFAASILLLFVSQSIQLEHQTNQAYAQTETVFRDALPDVVRVVNPRAQLKARISQVGGGADGDFLAMTSVLFRAISTISRARLESLQFESSSRRLNATLSLAAYSDIEDLRIEVERQGFLLEEGGTNSVDSRIVSEVEVRVP